MNWLNVHAEWPHYITASKVTKGSRRFQESYKSAVHKNALFMDLFMEKYKIA